MNDINFAYGMVGAATSDVLVDASTHSLPMWSMDRVLQAKYYLYNGSAPQLIFLHRPTSLSGLVLDSYMPPM